ncbi:MAG: GYD domain-containing protein [Acidimicrobiia bacterium]
MPRFLVMASYTPEGLRGVLKDGGTARKEVVEKLIADLGGTVESFYYAFGEADVFVIIDLPDNETAAALSMTIGASGAVSLKTVPLITPQEVDKAAKMSVAYKPPGK